MYRHPWQASPEWTRDLVIYEIAPKTFTSPRGDETGDFDGVRERLPALAELGITAIWLTGHSLSDPHHFFNIWMQYACVEPDVIDPSLGTEDDFRALIDEAHRLGIRVFLDVITHGLMPDSPVVFEHPEWFRGSTWHMTDFDWLGGHLDLDDWWVDVWTRYVTEFGVDGFRLDVDIYRPDLWSRIRRNAYEAGHPIVIFEETNSVIPGLTDFSEHDSGVGGPLLDDVPRFFDVRFGRAGRYDVRIDFADRPSIEGSTDGEGPLEVALDGLGEDRSSRRRGDRTAGDGVPDVRIRVEGVPEGAVHDVVVRNELGEEWHLAHHGGSLVPFDPETVELGIPDQAQSLSAQMLAIDGWGPTRVLHVPTFGPGPLSLMLSEHGSGIGSDGGDPYAARGSRAMFGYSFLFVPAIPLWMAGEEFDATFRPIPWMTPGFFGTGKPEDARMLYGSMLDWSEADEPAHREMWEDVARMLAIRRAHPSLLGVDGEGAREPRLRAATYSAPDRVPVPYVRWDDEALVLVAAHRDRTAPVRIRIDVPYDLLGADAGDTLAVTDLWNGGGSTHRPADGPLEIGIAPDGIRRGGLAVLRVERAV